MEKKVKTPIYDTVKSLLMGALAASKIVTGPYAWVANYLIPKFLDMVVKPIVIQWRLGQLKLKHGEIGKKKAKEVRDAKTVADKLAILNRKL